MGITDTVQKTIKLKREIFLGIKKIKKGSMPRKYSRNDKHILDTQ